MIRCALLRTARASRCPTSYTARPCTPSSPLRPSCRPSSCQCRSGHWRTGRPRSRVPHRFRSLRCKLVGLHSKSSPSHDTWTLRTHRHNTAGSTRRCCDRDPWRRYCGTSRWGSPSCRRWSILVFLSRKKHRCQCKVLRHSKRILRPGHQFLMQTAK